MANELYHYGVKGMKWGVRRNMLGTDYTPSSTNGGGEKDKFDKFVEEAQDEPRTDGGSGGGPEFEKRREMYETENHLVDFAGEHDVPETVKRGLTFTDKIKAKFIIKVAKLKGKTQSIISKGKSFVDSVVSKLTKHKN